jgi:hypothetical protein
MLCKKGCALRAAEAGQKERDNWTRARWPLVSRIRSGIRFPPEAFLTA